MDKQKQKELITEIMETDAKDGLYKKQTAVEWLISQQKHGKFFYDETIEQAKEMEKEQMFQVWKISEQWSDGKFLDSKKSFEEYYNETYKK